jgi:hypothetical protein
MRTFALLIAAACATTACTTVQPYAGQEMRNIKALSATEQSDLLVGKGMGLAKAAELNGYPGPMHTLELAQALSLSAQQLTASQALMNDHKARAREIGKLLLDAERQLDALFAAKHATHASVQQATADVGVLQARLRAEHLNTHLTQTALLSDEQVRRYSELRGYGSSQSTQRLPQQQKLHH